MSIEMLIHLFHFLLILFYNTCCFIHNLKSVFSLLHPFLVQFKDLVCVHLQLKVVYLLNILQYDLFLCVNLISNLVFKPIIFSLLFLLHRVETLAHVSEVNRELLINLILLVSIINHCNLKELDEVSKVLNLIF